MAPTQEGDARLTRLAQHCPGSEELTLIRNTHFHLVTSLSARLLWLVPERRSGAVLHAVPSEPQVSVSLQLPPAEPSRGHGSECKSEPVLHPLERVDRRVEGKSSLKLQLCLSMTH